MGKGDNFFVFPDILDESYVRKSEKQEPSEYSRGQYIFKKFVEVYGASLISFSFCYR